MFVERLVVMEQQQVMVRARTARYAALQAEINELIESRQKRTMQLQQDRQSEGGRIYAL
jgi:hypothetical protein